jgi:hypothetical protein
VGKIQAKVTFLASIVKYVEKKPKKKEICIACGLMSELVEREVTWGECVDVEVPMKADP